MDEVNSRPTWLKVFNWVALLLFVLTIVSFIIFLNMEFGGIGVLIVSIPLAGIALLLLSFNPLYSLRKHKMTVTANIILWILLIFFGIVFIISSLGLMHFSPFERWDIAGWFAWPFQLIIVVFLIVFIAFLNKHN